MVSKVTDPNKIVTDGAVLKELARQGIDKDYVEFSQDYCLRSEGGSPYAKFYRDLQSGKQLMVISGLPMVNAAGQKVDVGWLYAEGKYRSKANLFSCLVEGARIELTCLSDQPYGAKQSDRVNWQPQLFINDMEYQPINPSPTLLDADPVNSDYQQNTLEWDYAICKRRLRIIEGRLHGYWVFAQNPNGKVRIKYNQTGDFRLKLGQFAVSDDEEVIPPSIFNEAEYPFEVSDTATFYPDADPETSSVDGRARHFISTPGSGITWAALVAAAGTEASDTNASEYPVYIWGDSVAGDKWRLLVRGIFLFDTSSLPDDVTITAATLSLYGKSKADNLSITPDINIYSSNPASNTAVVAGDFDSLGDTAFSAAISYANYSIAGYNDFVFNSSGIAAISKTGVSKFGARNANYDVAVSTPPNHADTYSRLEVYFAEQGSGYKPKLVITYIVEKSSSDTGSGTESLCSRLLGTTETGSALEAALLISPLISGDEGSGFDALKARIEKAGSDIRLHDHPSQARIPSKGVNL